MKKLITALVIVVVLLIVFILLGPFFVLQEGELAVITRFGKIVNTHYDAGLKIKVPLVDTVVKYPKKIMSWDGEAQRIPTRENQFIWVDATARWRMSIPPSSTSRLTPFLTPYCVSTMLLTQPLERLLVKTTSTMQCVTPTVSTRCRSTNKLKQWRA